MGAGEDKRYDWGSHLREHRGVGRHGDGVEHRVDGIGALVAGHGGVGDVAEHPAIGDNHLIRVPHRVIYSDGVC